jgi:hypothetical protein
LSIAFFLDPIRDEHSAVVIESNEEFIEENVEIGDQQQAIFWVKSFLIVATVPWFDVRRSQNLFHGASANRALSIPTHKKIGSKLPLPQAGPDECFSLSFSQISVTPHL